MEECACGNSAPALRTRELHRQRSGKFFKNNLRIGKRIFSLDDRKLRIEPVGSVDVHCLSALLSNTSIPTLTLYADKSQVLETLYQIVTVADAPILLTASVSVSFSKFRSKAAAPFPLPPQTSSSAGPIDASHRSAPASPTPEPKTEVSTHSISRPFSRLCPTHGYTRHSSSRVCAFFRESVAAVAILLQTWTSDPRGEVKDIFTVEQVQQCEKE